MKTASILVVKILAGLLAGLGAFACLVPALEMNLHAHAIRGGSWFEAAPYVAGVFVAAAAGAILPIAKRHKAGEVAFACIVLGLVAVSFNLKNAMTASTLSRADFAEPRKAQIERIRAFEDRRAMLEKILAESSQGSPLQSSQELRAKLAMKEADPIFTRRDRSDRCKNPTISTSATFCAERAQIMADIARAEEREKAEAELTDIRRKLAGIETRPTVADPIVGNLANAAAFFIPVDESDHAVIGWANDLHTALFVELAAALGPMMFVFLLGLLWTDSRSVEDAQEGHRKPVTGEKAKAAAKPASALSADMPTCVRRFVEDSIVEAPGGKIGAGELYQAYVAGAMSEPVSQNKFGRLMKDAGLAKDGARYPNYVGIALRGPRLVAAAE